MAKYVCDFDQVREVANKLIESANTLRDETTSYSSKIEEDLAGWTGDAKDAFVTSKNEILTNTNVNVDDITILGEFINEAVSKIEDLETQLSTYKI